MLCHYGEFRRKLGGWGGGYHIIANTSINTRRVTFHTIVGTLNSILYVPGTSWYYHLIPMLLFNTLHNHFY